MTLCNGLTRGEQEGQLVIDQMQGDGKVKVTRSRSLPSNDLEQGQLGNWFWSKTADNIIEMQMAMG